MLRWGVPLSSTPHEETSIYTSVLEGGTLMQNFESDDQQEMQVEEEKSRNQEYPVHASGKVYSRGEAMA